MRNRTMTEIQLLSHMEQMDAMRQEFAKKYDWQWAAMRDHGVPERDVIETQIETWNRFRENRGMP